MSESRQAKPRGRLRIRAQRGTTVVEVAVLTIVFFTFVFGVLEVSRLLFVFNAIQDVTRRAAMAAVHVYPNDTTAIAKLKQRAVYRETAGELMFGSPVTDEYVRLAYLRYDLAVIPQSSWPADAAANRSICTSNPQAANCIRFVQAQLCDPGHTDACTAAVLRPLFPLVNLSATLHKATTIKPVETLGYIPGTPPPCPCS